MPHDAKKLLEDVRLAGAFIQNTTQGMGFAGYSQNEVLRAAVERKFTIIGAAISRLLLADAGVAAQITNYRKIIGFRNALIHGYSSVDDQVVWDAVQAHLPLLMQEITQLQANLP